MFKKINSISGPASLYIFFVNNKKYIFFGDLHFSNEKSCESEGKICDHYDSTFTDVVLYESDCTDFGALIHNWFTYNNEHNIKTDFYIETAFTKADERYGALEFKQLVQTKTDYFPYENESWLSLIADIMRPCFVRDKKNCNYFPNVHAHYADIRYTDTSEGTIFHDLFNLNHISNYIRNSSGNFEQLKSDYWNYLTILVENYDTIFGLMMDFDHYQTNMPILLALSEQFENQDMKEIYLMILNDMDEMTVIRDGNKMYRSAAEIIRLYNKNPDIAVKIYQYTKTQATTYITFLVDSLLEALNKTYDKKTFREIMYFYEHTFISIASLHMDMYTLARMFIQDESTEIITYTGDFHTKNYVNFFQTYFNNPSLIVDDNIRCLSSTRIPIYLDALKYKTYMHYRQEAIRILDALSESDTIQIPRLGVWTNITISRNVHPLFNTLYNINYTLNGTRKEVSWTKLATLQYLIRYIKYIS